jgi:DNA damage-binding protein 1
MECGHHGHVLALYIKTHGNIVVVGDLLRSVCLLRYRVSDGSLEEIARDFNSNYMRSIEILDDGHVVGAEDHGNIFVLKRNFEASSEEEKCRLDVQSGYHIGDFVNVFVRGSLSGTTVAKKSDGGNLKSICYMSLKNDFAVDHSSDSVIFGTVSGAIGTVLMLSADDFKFLSILEKSLKYVIKVGLHSVFKLSCNIISNVLYNIFYII